MCISGGKTNEAKMVEEKKRDQQLIRQSLTETKQKHKSPIQENKK